MDKKQVVISESLWREVRKKAFEYERSMKSIIEDAIVIWLLLDECGPGLNTECVQRMMIEKLGGRVVWVYRKITGKELGEE